MTQMHTTNNHIQRHNGSMSQRVLMVLIITAALVMLAFASMVSADTNQKPDHVIAETTNRMLDALKQEREFIRSQPSRVHELANQIIMPHVDFQKMSSWVLGKYWRRATAEQKQQFPAQFRNLILRTYATALSEYTDETISYLPLRGNDNATDVTVKTIIERTAGPGIPVAYRMHKTDDSWKVYDISIDGISLVNNYRRSFSSEIRRHGLDSLISKLTIKNRALVAKNNQLASN